MRKLLLTSAFILAAAPALALDLATARAQGILGEQPDGYVKVLKASPEATALAAQVNAGRKAEYEKISKQNGQPIDVVGALAAGQIAKKLGK